MTATTIYPGPWSHDALSPAQLDAVVSGVASRQGVAQAVLDRRIAVVAHREEEVGSQGRPRFSWRLSLTPLGVQLRRIEKGRRMLERLASQEHSYDPAHDYAAKDRALDGGGT